jgi:hypothetical protein
MLYPFECLWLKELAEKAFCAKKTITTTYTTEIHINQENRFSTCRIILRIPKTELSGKRNDLDVTLSGVIEENHSGAQWRGS